jgi:N-acetylmuramoyl-L-alanine amidase
MQARVQARAPAGAKRITPARSVLEGRGALRLRVRRTVRHISVLVAAAGFAWLAAPALSLDPPRPTAEDFEQRLEAIEGGATPVAARAATASHSHAGEGPVTHVSEPIAAPSEFDLAGIAGELRPYELRAREGEGSWSDWIETANGDPVYFGEADELQVRARGWQPAGWLHYVDVSTSGEDGGLVGGVRGAINDALVSVASLVQPTAEAETVRPDYVRRAEWGAKGAGGCHPRDDPGEGKVKIAVVHHTVTAGNYTPEEAPGIVLGICRFHRNGNGWNDIGYNALIDRFGTIYMGRAGGLGKAIIGAQAQGYNAQSTGVAAIGTHTTKPIREASLQSFAELLAWKLTHHGRPVRGRTRVRSAGGSTNRYKAGKRVRSKRITGHLKLNLTACPGGALKTQLKEIRARAAEIVAGTAPTPPKELPPSGGTGGG